MKKQLWKVICIFSILSYVSIGVVIAFFAPANVLEREWAKTLVEIMGFIPYVKYSGTYSAVPQVAQFFSCILLLISPLLVFVMLKTTLPLDKPIGKKIKLDQFVKFGVGYYFLLPLVLSILVAAPSNIKISIAETSTRLGLALLGTLHMLCITMAISLIIFGVYCWRYLAYGKFKQAK